MGPKADESLLCSVCRRVLPARAFSIDNSRPSGRQRTCRECVAVRYAKWYARRGWLRKRFEL